MQVTTCYWQLLLRRRRRNRTQGFTLIELLVVIVILGALAAASLPALLNQLGKARETAMKNAVGTINRTQQSYHFAEGVFAIDETDLDLTDISGTSPYIEGIAFASGAPAEAMGVRIENSTSASDGTRLYMGAISVNAGVYRVVMCRSTSTTATLDDTAIATVANTLDGGATVGASCASASNSEGTPLQAVN